MTTKRPLTRIYTNNGEFIDREMNDDEFAQHKIDVANSTARKAEAQAKENAKSAILERLGLTADELQTILG
jgi:hypothetical protein